MTITRLSVTMAKQQTIKQLRIAKNWSQAELSEHSTVNMQAISRMENGKPVSNTSFKRVCLALGVDPSDVVGVNVSRRIR